MMTTKHCPFLKHCGCILGIGDPRKGNHLKVPPSKISNNKVIIEKTVSIQ
jgi:hypothetical protein